MSKNDSIAELLEASKTYHYAQLNDQDICESESWLSEKIDASNMVILSDDEPSPIGKKYVDGKWIDMPPEAIPISETELLLTQIALNSDYLVCLAEINNM